MGERALLRLAPEDPILPQWTSRNGAFPTARCPTRRRWRSWKQRVADIRAGRAARARLAARTSAALHRGHQRQAAGPAAAHALSRPCRGPRRAVHLSRARPARGLRHARPARPPPGRAALRVRPRGMDHPHPGPLQRDRRTPRRPGRRLGGAARQAALPDGSPREDKIAAIGVRIRHWVSFHGISINVEPDLSHYAGIVPCGIAEHGVTSLVDLGLPVTTGRSRHGAGRDLRRGVRHDSSKCHRRLR